MVEGTTLLEGALGAGVAVETVFVGSGARLDRGLAPVLELAHGAGARVFDLAPGVLERVAGTVSPQPVLSVVAMAPARWERLEDAGFVVVCAEVRDPGNAGAVIRVADAAGADAVVCCAGTVDPYNPKTVRASAGSVMRLPVVEGGEAPEVLERLGRAGLGRVAAVAHGGVPYTEVEFGSRLALVLGNEASGLAPALDGHLDARVTVPLRPGVESLNVATAAAVLCFEVARQRSNLPAMGEPR